VKTKKVAHSPFFVSKIDFFMLDALNQTVQKNFFFLFQVKGDKFVGYI